MIGTSYINVGQNTSYFFKFDVVGSSILKESDGAKTINTSSFFSHQYMTNIMDPNSQSSSVYNMYASNGNLDANLNFIIPVYENMPTRTTLPTRFTQNDGELYYATSSLSVRDYTNYSSPVVYTLSKGEVVRMIGRKSTTSEGAQWDRVELENEWNCWVESSGLTSINEQKSEVDVTNLQIKIIPSATINDILDNFNVKDYSILDEKQNTVNDGKLATGYKLKVQNNTYEIIKLGDVDGDGQILALDALQSLKQSIGQITLSEIYSSAADVDKDGQILALDALTILKYSIGMGEINI